MLMRESTIDFVFFIDDCVITQSCKKQVIVKSTYESKYVVVDFCSCHSVWLRRFLEELYLTQDGTTEIFIDNKFV